MTSLALESIRVAAVGVGATVAMDLWLLALRRAGIPGLDFALLGRWVGHLASGTWSHEAIARACPVPGERALGWLTHYAVGIAFAALFVAFAGPDALRAPSLAGQPPTMIVTAGFDPLLDEGRAYGDRLRAAGVDVVYREYPGQIHAFVSLTKAIPQGLACTLEVADYLRRRLS